MDKELEASFLHIYLIDDGFGVVGAGSVCEFCKKDEMFFSLEQDKSGNYIFECPRCGKINVMNKEDLRIYDSEIGL